MYLNYSLLLYVIVALSTSAERIDHTSILGPKGVIPQSSCESKIKIHKVSYVWVIHHFHFHQKKLEKENGGVLKSPLFPPITESRTKWSLQLQKMKYDSRTILYLMLDDTGECKTTFGNFKFSFLDENKKELKVFADNDVKEIKVGRGEDNIFIKFKNDDVLLSTNKIIIYCEITFSEVDPVTNTFTQADTIKLGPNVPEFRVVEDIRQLFITEEFTDFVVSVKSKNYKVHKTILIARSKFFASMFKHENTQNKIDISDFDEKVVEEMLNYIYTGKSENLGALAQDLLAAAEKYGLDGLKNISENALAENLSIDNAVNMLLLADSQNARQLKSSTINFIVATPKEVMKTTAWKNIASSNPKLLLEVCEVFSLK